MFVCSYALFLIYCTYFITTNHRCLPLNIYFLIKISLFPMFRQPPLRAQIQQPLNVEMLSQQQQQQQQQTHQQQIKQNISPKRDGRTLLSQNVIHQSYGVAQQTSIGVNVTGGAGGLNTANIGTSIARQRQTVVSMGNAGNPNMSAAGGMLSPHLSMAYYSQTPPSQPYFGEVLHPMQVNKNS